MKKILVGVVAAVMSASVFAAPDKATQARIDELENKVAKLERSYQQLASLFITAYKADKKDTAIAMWSYFLLENRDNMTRALVKDTKKLEEFSVEFENCVDKEIEKNQENIPLSRVFGRAQCFTVFEMKFLSLARGVK